MEPSVQFYWSYSGVQKVEGADWSEPSSLEQRNGRAAISYTWYMDGMSVELSVSDEIGRASAGWSPIGRGSGERTSVVVNGNGHIVHIWFGQHDAYGTSFIEGVGEESIFLAHEQPTVWATVSVNVVVEVVKCVVLGEVNVKQSVSKVVLLVQQIVVSVISVVGHVEQVEVVVDCVVVHVFLDGVASSANGKGGIAWSNVSDARVPFCFALLKVGQSAWAAKADVLIGISIVDITSIDSSSGSGSEEKVSSSKSSDLVSHIDSSVRDDSKVSKKSRDIMLFIFSFDLDTTLAEKAISSWYMSESSWGSIVDSSVLAVFLDVIDQMAPRSALLMDTALADVGCAIVSKKGLVAAIVILDSKSDSRIAMAVFVAHCTEMVYIDSGDTFVRDIHFVKVEPPTLSMVKKVGSSSCLSEPCAKGHALGMTCIASCKHGLMIVSVDKPTDTACGHNDAASDTGSTVSEKGAEHQSHPVVLNNPHLFLAQFLRAVENDRTDTVYGSVHHGDDIISTPLGIAASQEIRIILNIHFEIEREASITIYYKTLVLISVCIVVSVSVSINQASSVAGKFTSFTESVQSEQSTLSGSIAVVVSVSRRNNNSPIFEVTEVDDPTICSKQQK